MLGPELLQKLYLQLDDYRSRTELSFVEYLIVVYKVVAFWLMDTSYNV